MAQGSNYARDRARAPLFTYVNEDKLKSIETYSRKKDFIHAFFSGISSARSIRSLLQACAFSFNADFINLLDNYEASTGVSETVTTEELQENRLFIDSIMETDVMKVQ